MTVILDLLRSKKFVAAIAGVIVAGAARIGWDLDVDAVLTIISPILAAILGQGLSDLGKERAKADAAVRYQGGSVSTGNVSGGSVTGSGHA